MPASPTVQRPSPEDFALYVHWPFCASKCPYCDFNSHVADDIDTDRWLNAYRQELAHAAALTPKRPLTSIYFGGGTPSLMPPDLVGQILERAEALWGFDAAIEITLEANPSSVENQRLAAMRAAGINRVSIGVQALNDAALKFLGRAHDQQTARDAISIAHSLFDRVTFDLIYGRPGQTVADWLSELDSALSLSGSHVSAYQLTIEKGTPFFADHRAGAFSLPNEHTALDLFHATAERLGDAGLERYEVSNYARRGHESRHNLTYWQYGDYVGVGPGAHGRLTIGGAHHRTETQTAPHNWLSAVEKDGHAFRVNSPLADWESAGEMLMMGLRLSDGLNLKRFSERIGKPLQEFVSLRAIQSLVDAEYLMLTDTRLKATEAGIPVLNAVIATLVESIAGVGTDRA